MTLKIKISRVILFFSKLLPINVLNVICLVMRGILALTLPPPPSPPLYATVYRDGEGHTALWCATREQRFEMVNYLISRGAKVRFSMASRK